MSTLDNKQMKTYWQWQKERKQMDDDDKLIEWARNVDTQLMKDLYVLRMATADSRVGARKRAFNAARRIKQTMVQLMEDMPNELNDIIMKIEE